MRQDIDFFYVISRNVNANPRVTKMGRGSDGSLWVQASFVRLDGEVLEEIRQRDYRLLIFHPLDGCIYVDVQALLHSCESIEEEKRFIALKDAFLDRLHPTNFRE